MKTTVFKRGILPVLTVLICAIFILVPFHAFLTVWVASNFGHYTAWRLWDEVVLVVATLLVIISLCLKPTLARNLSRQRLFWLIIAYIVLELIWAGVAYGQHQVTAKALGYGLIVNLRFLVFFLVCLVVSGQSDWLKKWWRQLLLIPAALVVVFGLAQFFIFPYDFLRHFGYSAQTIFPYETINNNLHYRRIISTLRGANPLGAYLVVIVSVLAAEIRFAKERRWQIIYGCFGLATAAAFFLSYSRGAWIGAVLAVLIIFCIKVPRAKLLHWGLAGLIIVVIAGGAGVFILKNNSHWQNIVTHTQSHTAAKTTSDQGHLSSLKTGLKDLVRQPLGRGPGTAGPASVYNNHPARIAENYFVQIGQEVGWLGLALFLAINCLVGFLLWQRRSEPLALTLLASLVGISFVNLLSHAWADDTLSYVWWGLAGLALSRPEKQGDETSAVKK